LKLAAPDPLPPAAGAPGLHVDIRVSNVRYSYPAAPRPALNGLTLRMAKGESVGLVGPSGSGKSTLVDVILALLPPEAGQVLVDGHDIQHNLRDWQDQIGYVPQSIYLTDDTLRRNVAFGLADTQIDDAAVRLAIKSAQLEEYVASLPAGLETIVGERGVRLSGGQRQRIGIARALYHVRVGHQQRRAVDVGFGDVEGDPQLRAGRDEARRVANDVDVDHAGEDLQEELARADERISKPQGGSPLPIDCQRARPGGSKSSGPESGLRGRRDHRWFCHPFVSAGSSATPRFS
jgi:ABC-type lipoprotein export system ATPase subunit